MTTVRARNTDVLLSFGVILFSSSLHVIQNDIRLIIDHLEVKIGQYVIAKIYRMDLIALPYLNGRKKWSLVMRKPAFCICENKDADQLRGNREADQRLYFRYTNSTIPLLPINEIPRL